MPGQTKIIEVPGRISANKLWACQTKSLQQTRCCVVKVIQWVWDMGSNHQQVLYVMTWSLCMLEIHWACHLNTDVEVFFRLLQKTVSSHLTKTTMTSEFDKSAVFSFCWNERLAKLQLASRSRSYHILLEQNKEETNEPYLQNNFM